MFCVKLLLLCTLWQSASHNRSLPAVAKITSSSLSVPLGNAAINQELGLAANPILVLADGKPTPSSASYHFHTGTRLLIDYRALPLLEERYPAYRYQLSPADAQPIYTRVGHIVLENLGPGHYHFTVSACDESRLCSPQTASIAITVEPVFYQAPLFLPAVALAICALAYAGFLWRTRYLKDVAAQHAQVRVTERERIARELHDTLLQSVQGLTLHFQAAAQALNVDDPLRAQLENALTSADSIMNDARDQVRDLRSYEGRRVDLLAAFQQAGRELKRAYEGPELRVTSEGRLPVLRPEISQEVFSVGVEALRNALHHSQGSLVSLNIKYGLLSMKVMVYDNGVGVDPVILDGGKPGHWGLPGMRERADKICGRLSLSSVKGSGTRVTLRVPAAIAYVDRPAIVSRLLSSRSSGRPGR